MKTLIVALNSKYIHSALAPWYLKAACGDKNRDISVLEHTINESYDYVLSSIYIRKPDVIAFSCYIWNIAQVIRLTADLKKLLPKSVIILGGPEVSYDSYNILVKHNYIDFVLSGEGETSFPKLLQYIEASITPASSETDTWQIRKPAEAAGAELKNIEGLSYRDNGRIVTNPPATVAVLDDIPSPYTDEMLSSLKNRIAYFETTRGCPFSCSYCLSSACTGVRYFSLERVFSDLDRLLSAGVSQIKFVDRTFNFNKKRALEIVNHIISLNVKNCNFHFEVGADLFDDKLLTALEKAPSGLFQVEAGVQTTNKAALSAIARKTNLTKLFANLKRLVKSGNVHVHADLIAGLPYEDYSSFSKSFNDLYSVEPQHLQLGFLKFLKGTAMRENAEAFGYHFYDLAPYEILSGNNISYDELIVLKGIAHILDKFYNTGRFELSLRYIVRSAFKSPFDFYESFYNFYSKEGYLNENISLKEMYHILNRFAGECMEAGQKEVFDELMKLDFLASDNSGTLPGFLKGSNDKEFNEKCYAFVKDTPAISRLIPEAASMHAKELYKRLHFEKLYANPITLKKTGESVFLFNYISKSKVTGRYPFYIVKV